MKRPIAITTFIAFGLVTLAAVASDSPPSVGNIEDGTSDVLEISPAESRTFFPGSAEYFTGTVAVDMLFQPNGTRNASAATVEFAPGARTAWHSHPAGQTLIVTSGTGWVQISGRARQAMKEGDVVWIPAQAKHWHGATDATAMTHIAIQEQRDGQVVHWLESVSDEQYLGAGTDE
jgi:quercetin dioxygenase-like cupin family protein